jgi:hypothetical protein
MSPYKIIEKKKVVFDMTCFNSAFKKKINQQGDDDDGFPTKNMIRDIPDDNIAPIPSPKPAPKVIKLPSGQKTIKECLSQM